MNKHNLYIFDLDGTLWDGDDFYNDVYHILLTLRKEGHLIYLASFNPLAPAILESHRLRWLFNGGSYGIGRSKYTMIKEILAMIKSKNYGIPNAIYFFDDLEINIMEVSKNSKVIHTIHTPDGVSWEVMP